MDDYVDHSELGFLAQLKLLKTGAAATGIAAKYGFSTNDLQSMVDDWFYFDWIVTNRHLTEAYVHAISVYEHLARHGSKTAILGGFPLQPVFAAVPANVVAEDIEQRFRDHANKIKATAGYNVADGKAMGVEGVKTVFVPADGKPKIHVVLNGGYPELHIIKGHYHAANFYKDSGSGFGTTPFKTVTTTKFLDTSPLPAANVTQLLKFKAIYLLKDVEVGHESDVISIAVVGK